MVGFALLLYLLTSFATVAEAKAALPSILVNRSSLAVFKMPVLLHVTLHDAGGASLVIEYVGGRLTMFDNPTGRDDERAALRLAPGTPGHVPRSIGHRAQAAAHLAL